MKKKWPNSKRKKNLEGLFFEVPFKTLKNSILDTRELQRWTYITRIAGLICTWNARREVYLSFGSDRVMIWHRWWMQFPSDYKLSNWLYFGPFFGIYTLKRGVKPLLLDDFVFFIYKHIQYLYLGIKVLTLKKTGFFLI